MRTYRQVPFHLDILTHISLIFKTTVRLFLPSVVVS